MWGRGVWKHNIAMSKHRKVLLDITELEGGGGDGWKADVLLSYLVFWVNIQFCATC